MTTLAHGLFDGTIDQFDSIAHFTWVKTRVNRYLDMIVV
jgi:hypothetical protein